ncbi:MAG: aminotransferase class I/II-fold pyridoxal phosphate-dependent enzyme [Acidimicrobiales bacterium]
MTSPSVDRPVHGGNGARLAEELGIDPASVLDLSASLCPVAPDPSPAVQRHLGALGRYPDPEAATAALAEAMGVQPEHLLLTNGGAEAIALAGAVLGGTVEEPDFSLYPRAGGPLWRSNPNNPLGTLAPSGAKAGVWDEAFWPLATGTWTRGDHLQGSVVVGSLTKLLACPGLRVGYVLCADDALMWQIRRRQPEWSVNGLAADALADLLRPVDLPAWSSQTAALRDQLADLLRSHELAVHAGDGPWVLVDRSGSLRAKLLTEGIAVRDCASFGMGGTVRIAVPRPDQFGRLERALRRHCGGDSEPRSATPDADTRRAAP